MLEEIKYALKNNKSAIDSCKTVKEKKFLIKKIIRPILVDDEDDTSEVGSMCAFGEELFYYQLCQIIDKDYKCISSDENINDILEEVYKYI